MEAFDKWFDEIVPKDSRQNYDPLIRRLMQESWKAALEWALEQTDTGETDMFPVINPRWLRYELENRKSPEDELRE